MKKTAAILLGKFLNFIFRWRKGGGTSYPGRTAMKFDPLLLQKFRYPKEVIFVTGTNGKTGSTLYISEILKRSGRVVTNREGANMPQGLATVLLKNCSLTGRVRADYCVFEVDEGHFPRLAQAIRPTAVLLTNLFPDQEDRFGGVEELRKRIAEGLNPEATLFFNANEPHSVWISKNSAVRKTFSFGLDAPTDERTRPTLACPVCGSALNYEKIFYETVGECSCSCGFQTPLPDWIGTDVDYAAKKFSVRGKAYALPYDILYFVFNALGVIALTREFGAADEDIQEVLRVQKVERGRMEHRGLTFVQLVKNAAGLNQALDYIQRTTQAPTDLYIAVHLNYADGRDPAWLHNGKFFLLKDRPVERILIAGMAREELKAVLTEQGLGDRLVECEDVADLTARSAGSTRPHHMLANYSALAQIQQQWQMEKEV